MIKSVILHLDMFAPHFEFYVNKDQTRFQSIFGGVFTLIIGILTLIYAIVNINMWATNGRQPTVTSYQTNQQFTEIVSMESLNLIVQDYQEYVTDYSGSDKLYREGKLAIIPLIQFPNSMVNESVPLTTNCSQSITTNSYRTTFCIPQEYKAKLNLRLTVENFKENFIIYFKKCSPEYIRFGNLTCANSEEINEYLETNSLWQLGFDLTSYDQLNSVFNTVTYKDVLTLDQKELPTRSLTFIRTETCIDKGYQVVGPEISTVFSDYNLKTFNLAQNDKTLKLFKENGVVSVCLFTCSIGIQRINFQHTQITDLMIMIFSFARMLVSIGNVVVKKRGLLRLTNKILKYVKPQSNPIKEEPVLFEQHSMKSNYNQLNLYNLVIQLSKLKERNEQVSQKSQIKQEPNLSCVNPVLDQQHSQRGSILAVQERWNCEVNEELNYSNSIREDSRSIANVNGSFAIDERLEPLEGGYFINSLTETKINPNLGRQPSGSSWSYM